MRIRRLWPVVTLSVLFVTLCAVTGLAQSQYRYSIFPQLAVGEGWSDDIFVTNQDSANASVRVSLFSNPGTPLVVSSNLGSGSVFNFEVAPGATEVLRVTFSGATTPGYALLRAPSGVSIRSSLVVRWMNNEVVMTQLGVTSQFPFTHFSFPAEINPAKQTNTGMALALPVIDGLPFEAQEFVVALINEDGTLRDVKAVELAPGEHLAKFINEEPFFTDVTSFNGSVSVFCNELFGLLALRLEQGALGSLTISSGPVTGPYLVSGGSSETEPNNLRTNANALTLPARVTGVIGNASDQDYFSFSGRRGDIVTALTDIRGLDSDADTILVLMDSAGNVLCSNDQNGFNNNSFLQCALPADGTYYLQVTEWTERGGSTFTYNLHVTLNGDGTPPVVPAPVVNSVTPNNATAGTTTTITIAGTNLSGTSAVLIDPGLGVSVGSINSTATQVTASVTVSSTATPGSRTIAVQTAGGTSNTLPFQINPPAVPNTPTITSLSPTSVTQGESPLLTINGTNLGSGGATTVNITPATGITMLSPSATGTQVTVILQVSPTAPVGTRQVSVTTANGTSNTLNLTVAASGSGSAPVITSVTPNNADLGADIDITITGTNLSGANQVTFSPYVAVSVSQINATATQVTASLFVFPSATPGNYTISVRTPAGTSNGLPFTVNTPPPPTITAMSPVNATQGVKYRLNIVGTNMDWETTLSITPSTGLTITNKSAFQTHLSADLDVSAGAPLGARQVTVTGKGGTSNTLTMTIVGPGSGGTAPTISNVTVGTVTWNGSTATVPVSFDFTDPDADIIYTQNNLAASAAVVFSVSCSTNRFSGTSVNKPGVTSGTFHLNVQVESASHGTSTVNLQLIDAGGHYSNTLTFQTTGWRGCELNPPSSLELKQDDDAGGWMSPPPAALVRDRPKASTGSRA